MVLRLIYPFLSSVLSALIFFVYIMPNPLMAARLELRHTDTAATDLSIVVGQEIEIDLWVDSDNQPLSGAAVFISFDSNVFELVGEDRDGVSQGFQPFAPGDFLTNGEIFRNALLHEDDPAAIPSGIQLDYSVVRAVDQGQGAAASFKLLAKAPTKGSMIRIDESGIRETRFFTPDGSQEYFRFITPLYVQVHGIDLKGLPSELVLGRGHTDTTTFLLDKALFDPIYDVEDIEWTIVSAGDLLVEHLTDKNLLRVTAPHGSSPWERLTITASNPDNQVAVAVIDIFVNEGPSLSRMVSDLQLVEDEEVNLDLEAMVEDPDTPMDQLHWNIVSENSLAITIQGPPYIASVKPLENWHGETDITITVTDNYGFSDTTSIAVAVQPINDAPKLKYSPNIQLTLGKQDSTLLLSDLIADPDDSIEHLHLSWIGNKKITIETLGNRLVLSAFSNWIGTENIELKVRDNAGSVAVGLLTVTTIPSLPPSLINPPNRLGIVPGDKIVLELNELVLDPDDPLEMLAWHVHGRKQLSVQINGSGAALLEAGGSFSGIETLTFEVRDPSGEIAHFDLLVFSAPPGGEPVIVPVPEIELPIGGIDASIDLDHYVFDLNHEPNVMQWDVPDLHNLNIRVDPISHVLTIAPTSAVALGSHKIELRVSDPDGNQATQILSIKVIDDEGTETTEPELPTTIPTLAPLPSLTIQTGTFDQSIVLDDFLTGIDPASLSWTVEQGNHTQILIDKETRQVTVLADSDWTGPEIILFRATDSLGNLLEAALGVQIIPAVAELELSEGIEVNLLEGDTLFSLDLSSVLMSATDPADLTWQATAMQPISIAFDADSEELIFSIDGSTQDTELVTITANDADGNQATISVLLNVHPADGSFGLDSDDLSIVVIPNAVQTDYLDVYLISLNDVGRKPRLRQNNGDKWSELQILQAAENIWHGIHILQPGTNGSIDFLGLTSTVNQQIIKTNTAISLGTVSPASAKRIVASGFSAFFDTHAFAKVEVVTIIPESIVSESQPELMPLSQVMRVHATGPYNEGSATVQFKVAEVHPEKTAVYRWTSEHGIWSFVGGNVNDGWIMASVEELGRYAVFHDGTAPNIWLESSTYEELVYRFTERGSGIESARVWLGESELIPLIFSLGMDHIQIALNQIPQGDHELHVEITDRNGNRAVTVSKITGLGIPAVMQLDQNFPNPFNPETVIPLDIASDRIPLQLRIFNSNGQLVRTLFEGPLSAGQHRFLWDGLDDLGREVASGVYLYRAQIGSQTRVRKMNLVR